MAKRSGVSKAAGAKTELYCYCNGPDTGAAMIACEKCGKWFHGECIGLSPGHTVDDVDLFLCGCSLKKDKAIRYKKRRASKAIKGSADAGAKNAAASAPEGEASTSKEEPVDSGSDKKALQNKGRVTRSKQAVVDSSKHGRV